MIDVISGGRLIAGFPVGSPMDTCFAYGQNPSMLRERYLEAHDLVVGRGPSRTPSRSTAASTSSATSTSGRARCRSRTRRSGSRAAARSRPGAGAPRWTMSTATCPISATRPGRRRWTASGPRWTGSARTATRTTPAFCNSSASPRAARRPTELYREPAEYFYGRCLHVDPRFAGPPGYTTEETQRARHPGPGAAGRRAKPRATRPKFATLAREMDAIVDKGYVIIGSPDEVAEQLKEVAHNAQCRPPDAAAAVRQHEQGPGEVQHRAVRREGHAAAERRLLRMGGPLVAAADGTATSAPPLPLVPAGGDGGGVGGRCTPTPTLPR